MSDEKLPPLLEPKLCDKLCERERVVDFGLRKKFWEHMGETVRERRRPDNIADKVAERAVRTTEKPLRNAARERARERFMNVGADEVVE